MVDMSMRESPDPQGHRGVETVMFNTCGYRVGKIGPDNFEQQWAKIRQTVYEGMQSKNDYARTGID